MNNTYVSKYNLFKEFILTPRSRQRSVHVYITELACFYEKLRTAVNKDIPITDAFKKTFKASYISGALEYAEESYNTNSESDEYTDESDESDSESYTEGYMEDSEDSDDTVGPTSFIADGDCEEDPDDIAPTSFQTFLQTKPKTKNETFSVLYHGSSFEEDLPEDNPAIFTEIILAGQLEDNQNHVKEFIARIMEKYNLIVAPSGMPTIASGIPPPPPPLPPPVVIVPKQDIRALCRERRENRTQIVKRLLPPTVSASQDSLNKELASLFDRDRKEKTLSISTGSLTIAKILRNKRKKNT